MVDRRKVVELWKSREVVALATLIRIEGSSYRKEGARLLIAKDGSYAGSVSGGCLEAEIVRKAEWLTRDGATVEHYSTLFDDTAEIPYGLGCGGTVDVLIERAGTSEFEALMAAFEASLGGETRDVTTWLPKDGSVLMRKVQSPGEGTLFLSPGAASRRDDEALSESLSPPHRLFVFGAGEDARPMVELGAFLGWSVHVHDGRPQWARAERFPAAGAVVNSAKLKQDCPREEDAVVLMTHSYEADREWLKQVLPCKPRYIGLLGSRHRSALLVEEAARALGWTVPQACEHIFSPVGLDLGGDGAEAIALSTIAEIQACVQGKLPHSRRLTPEEVSRQLDQGGASRYLQLQCAL